MPDQALGKAESVGRIQVTGTDRITLPIFRRNGNPSTVTISAECSNGTQCEITASFTDGYLSINILNDSDDESRTITLLVTIDSVVYRGYLAGSQNISGGAQNIKPFNAFSPAQCSFNYSPLKTTESWFIGYSNVGTNSGEFVTCPMLL